MSFLPVVKFVKIFANIYKCLRILRPEEFGKRVEGGSMSKPDISVDIVTQVIVTIGPDEKKTVKEGISYGIKELCNGFPQGQRPGLHEEKAGDFTRILLNVSGLVDSDPEDLKKTVRGVVNEVLAKDSPQPSGNGSEKWSSLTLTSDQ